MYTQFFSSNKVGLDTSSLRLHVQGREFRSADNEILLPQAQVALFGNRVIRGGVFQDLPADLKIYVRLLQFPNTVSYTHLTLPTKLEV